MALIGIIDADLIDHGTRHPNLALMKIAGYLKEKGNEVELIYRSFEEAKNPRYSELYMGCVFSFTKVPEEIKTLPNMKLYGGTGFFPEGDGPQLPFEVEHHMPYYDLYKEYVDAEIARGIRKSYFSDYLQYSIGFTSRGCFRKCSFCVNKKYDHAFRHSPVKEFMDDTRPYIYLWDDNIMALGQWEEIIDELEATGKPYQFRQGIDLRLMTDHKAERLVNAHYHGDFIFAFDHIEDRDLIIEKVQLWRRYSARICKMYVISGYNSQDEHDIADVFERIKILMTYGSLPYIMRYEAYKKSQYRELYVQIARWCNQPQFLKKMSFREFCIANQRYKKDQSTNCAAYQSMLDFEEKFPAIAEKYFDLKFDELNIYKTQYGYGRRYANKPLCLHCRKVGLCWSELLKDKVKLIQAYLTKQVDLECLRYRNADCDIKPIEVAKVISNVLLETPLEELISILKDIANYEKPNAENIIQFSSLEHALINVPEILNMFTDTSEVLNFEKIGFYLERSEIGAKLNSVTAMKKYGENHAKMAALVDLAVVSKTDSRAEVTLSEFGKYFVTLEKNRQKELALKLCLRIPIIQNYFLNGRNREQIEKDLSVLSKTTQNRRRSNVLIVVRSIEEGKIL